MHELGLLREIVKTVEQAAVRNGIDRIRYITLEIGRDSGVVPLYMKKLFPVAADALSLLRSTELRITMIRGSRLVIKEIGY